MFALTFLFANSVSDVFLRPEPGESRSEKPIREIYVRFSHERWATAVCSKSRLPIDRMREHDATRVQRWIRKSELKVWPYKIVASK